MRWFRAVTVFCAALIGVFLQARCGLIRHVVGAQLDLLPALVVYVSLTGGIGLVAFAAIWGGLCFDALSVNPLGNSILPLFVVGLVIHRNRTLIMHQQFTTRFVLGAITGLVVPVLSILLLWSTGHKPLVGLGSVWQLLVMSAGAGILTPVVFKLFEYVDRTFAYQQVGQTSFRHDREIRRNKALKVGE